MCIHLCESIDGVSNTVAFEYDSFGRLYKKTFNSVDYEQYDYQNGYLYKIGFNGTTVWQATAIDEYSRVRAANMGSTAATWGYNTTTNLLSQIKGAGVQQYDYNFSGTTRNLTTRYIWIGGDAYTAVAVATKEGAGSWTVYNIFRDHLGTITHLKTGSIIIEYSFDAWGRRRNKDDWSYTLTNEPALFADRGFTGHEFLADFNLYNMNGRLYDPVVGRFLSPDPFIADPSFSQSYNRYAYCLNNPLKYIDPDGEFLLELLTVIVGNYVFSWLDNVINKHMSPKDAFRNTNFIIGVNFSPTDMSRSKHYGLSNSQVDAFKAAKHEEKVSKELDRMVPQGGGGTCPNCLDPSTVGQNLLGLSYPGGNNPRTYAGDYSYSYVPLRLSEYPAIGHDRRYDNLGTAGTKGLLTDTRAIGADWRFVGEELSIALNPFADPISRMQAGILGVGLGAAALPKTIYQLGQTNGLINIIIWYNISNVGVTNTPDIHKH